MDCIIVCNIVILNVGLCDGWFVVNRVVLVEMFWKYIFDITGFELL